MCKRQDGPLNVTLEELRTAGFLPVVARNVGGHWKIKCDGLPPITVSCTSGDQNASKQARRTVRKIIAQNSR